MRQKIIKNTLKMILKKKALGSQFLLLMVSQLGSAWDCLPGTDHDLGQAGHSVFCDLQVQSEDEFHDGCEAVGHCKLELGGCVPSKCPGFRGEKGVGGVPRGASAAA